MTTSRWQLWKNAKDRADKNNIPFDIRPVDIVVPSYCPILGMQLKSHKGAMQDNSPTVDRIIPEKGYTKGNIVVVSNRANRLKSNATLEELIRITSFYGQIINDGTDTTCIK